MPRVFLLGVLLASVPSPAFAQLSDPARPGSSAESQPSAPPAEPSEPPEPEVSGPMVDELHVALGAGGHMALGTAPAIALGSRITAELITRRWSLGIEARYDLSTNSTPTVNGRAPRTALAGASFVPCLRARAAWACGVVLASRITGQGSDPADPSLWVGFGARFEMHFALPGDFAIRVLGEVLAHPFAYELLANGQRVFRSSALSAMFGPALVRAF